MTTSRLKAAESASPDHVGAGEWPEGERFQFVGNHPALDFTNTVDWTTRGSRSNACGRTTTSSGGPWPPV